MTYNPVEGARGYTGGDPDRVTLKELLDLPDPPVEPEPPKPFTTQSIRGTGMGVNMFRDGQRLNQRDAVRDRYRRGTDRNSRPQTDDNWPNNQTSGTGVGSPATDDRTAALDNLQRQMFRTQAMVQAAGRRRPFFSPYFTNPGLTGPKNRLSVNPATGALTQGLGF